MAKRPTVLVTGGAGFIGSTLVRYLLEDVGMRVVTVDKLSYAGSRLNLRDVEGHPNHEFVHMDIAHNQPMAALIAAKRPQFVMHLAAESHVDRSIDGPSPFIESNIVGTYSLLEGCLGYWQHLPQIERSRFRLLHVSTDEVYGSLGRDDAPFCEKHPYRPRSPYSASKASSDHLASAWHHTYGLPVVISNCSNNYGPYQFPEKLIPVVILNAHARRPIPVYGRGENIRDWLHVHDHVRALWTIAQHGRCGERYNVGGNNELSNLDLVQRICKVLDHRVAVSQEQSHARLITFTEDRPGHDFRYAMDTSKIECELGWRAEWPFDQGLASTVDWYLEHLDWCQQVAGQRDTTERQGLTIER